MGGIGGGGGDLNVGRAFEKTEYINYMNSFKLFLVELVIVSIFRNRKIDFFINFYSFILKMDENKYNNIYNAMSSNQSYQTYYINNISNNYSNSTITQQQFNFIKDDLIKYINK